MKLIFEKETPNYSNRAKGLPMLSMATRIKSKVNVTKNGCWNWLGSYRKSGYGKMNVGSTTDGSRHTVTVSRASYETFVGPIPPGLVVCHKCDNPKCVNPDHLFVGTFKDNFDDMVAKGRQRLARGTRIASAKLDNQKVRQIRKSSLTVRELSEKYGVDTTTIRHVLKGDTWKHV